MPDDNQRNSRGKKAKEYIIENSTVYQKGNFGRLSKTAFLEARKRFRLSASLDLWMLCALDDDGYTVTLASYASILGLPDRTFEDAKAELKANGNIVGNRFIIVPDSWGINHGTAWVNDGINHGTAWVNDGINHGTPHTLHTVNIQSTDAVEIEKISDSIFEVYKNICKAHSWEIKERNDDQWKKEIKVLINRQGYAIDKLGKILQWLVKDASLFDLELYILGKSRGEQTHDKFSPATIDRAWNKLLEKAGVNDDV